MTIEIRKPELERLMQEEIPNGHFQSIDVLLGSDLNLERQQDYGRSIEL